MANILKYLQKSGHDVFCCGVSSSNNYPDSKGFLSYPKRALKEIGGHVWYAADYSIIQLVERSTEIRDSLLDKISFVPDVIIVEMPWLFKLAEQLRDHWRTDIPIIYSSENIEYRLRQKILNNFNIKSDELIQGIKEVEEYAALNSSANWAVSETDVEWLKSFSNVKTYLVPNGVEARKVTQVGECKFKSLDLPKKFVLFCGSAHMPNISGLYEAFKEGMGCIPPDSRLVIVGSICDAIRSDERFTNIVNFRKRTCLLGLIDEELLASLLKHSHCIILPIRDGGGTNLKTAEAIWTGSYIVANSTAFRGFDQFCSSENVFITDDAARFQQQIRYFLGLERNNAEYSIEKRKVVLWDSCLNKISDCLDRVKINDHLD